MLRWNHLTAGVLLAVLVWRTPVNGAEPESDPYAKYVKTSRDFQPVKQDKEWCQQAFPSWTYMPEMPVGLPSIHSVPQTNAHRS